MLSHSPAYEETFISPTGRAVPLSSMMHTAGSLNSNRRTVSDPFGDLRGLANRSTERMGDTFPHSAGQPTFRGGKYSRDAIHFLQFALTIFPVYDKLVSQSLVRHLTGVPLSKKLGQFITVII